jgi:hypothetical protein
VHVLIAAERMSVTHQYLGQPRLRVVKKRDDGYSGNSVEASKYLVMLDIVSLVNNFHHGIVNNVTVNLIDVVSRYGT